MIPEQQQCRCRVHVLFPTVNVVLGDPAATLLVAVHVLGDPADVPLLAIHKPGDSHTIIMNKIIINRSIVVVQYRPANRKHLFGGSLRPSFSAQGPGHFLISGFVSTGGVEKCFSFF